jgi:hypothetical protein
MGMVEDTTGVGRQSTVVHRVAEQLLPALYCGFHLPPHHASCFDV